MKFYLPKLQIATLQPPQTTFRNKFGGLPWGLPMKWWRRCQYCGRLMGLLAQLSHDPPAIDLGGPSHALHLFQCQDPGCDSTTPGAGNDAVMVPMNELGHGLTLLPDDEDLGGCRTVRYNRATGETNLDRMIGELWIDGWEEHDDGFDHGLAADVFDYEKWLALPDVITHQMFGPHWRTKMGGVPYFSGNGPPENPPPGYEFLFQLDSRIYFLGTPPTPDECGAEITVIVQDGHGDEFHEVRHFKSSAGKEKLNAPWDIVVETHDKERFGVEITNLGSDGTAYVFINRQSKPADAFWLWRR